MKTVYVLLDSFMDGAVHGVYAERADAEADFYDFCYEEVYIVMMTYSPMEVFRKEQWEWKKHFECLMRDCANTLIIAEVPYYD